MIPDFISQNYHRNKSFYNKSFVAFILKVLSQILALAIFVILARIMDVQEFGLYVLAMGWARIILIADKGGMDMAVNRYLAKYQGYEDWKLFHSFFRFGSVTVLVLSSAFLVLGLIGIIFLPFSLSGQEFFAFLVALLIPPLWARMHYEQASLRAIHETTLGQIPDALIRPGLIIIFISLAWATDIKITALTALNLTLMAVIGALIIAFLMRIYKFRDFPSARFSPDQGQRKEWLFCGLSLVLITASVILLRHTDIVMLGALVPVGQVGIYGAAAKIADIATFALGAVNMVLAPVISSCYSKGDHLQLKRVLRQAVAINTGFAVIVGGGLLIFSNTALSLFGSEFPQASHALKILLIAQIFNAACGPAGFVLTMTGHHRFASIVYAGVVGINILANYILIPLYGIQGAAIATAGSIVLWNFVFVYYSSRYLGYNPSLISLMRPGKE